MHIRIATRNSPLAITQALIVANLIRNQYPKLNFELVKLKTKGDILVEHSLSKVSGKGLFIKEIEQALIDNYADIAVHSMKDIPVQENKELEIKCFIKRGDPRDVFISTKYKSFLALPKYSSIGTSSNRRRGQILALRPDLKVKNIRGNIDTRINKMKGNYVDAIILAASGLKRNRLSKIINHYFDIDKFLPAIAQGVIGVQNRVNNTTVKHLLRSLNHKVTQLAVNAERSFLKNFNGNCSTPIASYCNICGDRMILRSGYFFKNGSSQFYTIEEGNLYQGEMLGIRSSERIKKMIL